MTETSKPTLLIVDDEPEMLYSLTGLLRRDYTVLTAESGAQALELLQDRPVDVVMTDQRMPEMTGVELLARVRERQPDVARIVFTGYSDVKAVTDAINEGSVYRYITKPWDPAELTAILRQAAADHAVQAERRALMEALRRYHGQTLGLLRGLHEGRFGELNAEGQRLADTLSDHGAALLQRLERLSPGG